MKSCLSALILLTVVLYSTARAEESTLELATQRGCFVCHAVQYDSGASPPLAPSYQDIATRYRDDDKAFQYLVDRILHGTLYTEQNWSNDISMRFMPPNINVSRVEAAELANWVLKMPVDQSRRQALARHQAMLILVTRSGCTSCHLMDAANDARLMPLAPAFREIAARYRGQDAQAALAGTILGGSSASTRKWPNANMQFMPANVGLAKPDAEQLADWILNLD